MNSAPEPEYLALVREKREAATRKISKPNGTGMPVEPATTTPPRIVAPDFAHLPQELTAAPLWVLHIAKEPYQPNGHRASSTDSGTWRPFAEVVAAYQRGGFDGIGFVFAGNFWGADFDHVTDADGRFLDSTIEDEVRALAVGAYCERSVSGTGAHIIGRYSGEPLKGKNPANEIREAYVTARYFTVTGRPVPGIPSAATLADTTAQFLAWRAAHFEEDDKTATTAASQTTMAGACSLDDLTSAERDAIVTGRTHDPRFDGLWRGESTGPLKADGSPDGSAADYDFLCCLVRVTDCRDLDRLELMARCSARYRDKWDDHRTYLRGTIAKALRDNPTARAEFGDTSGTTTPGTMTQTAAPNKTPRLYFELLDHVTPTLDQQALIKDLLAVAAMSVLYGESNSGKTFVALSLAFCIAANLRWMGRAVHSGLVIYVAAEAGGGARKRLAALRVEYGAQARGAPLALVPCPIDLSGRGVDVQPLLDLMTQAVTATGRPLVLVVIDTLSRAMGGGNENAPEDMTAFIKNVDRIRAATKAHVMVIHHSGKDRAKGARGHSSLRAATDTELEIADKTILVTKQRDMEQGAPIGFDLKPLVIGHDSQGAPITSCVVIPRSLTAEHDFTTGRIKPGSVPGKALAILEDLTAGVGTILIDTWKDRFISAHYTGNSKAGWTAFDRAREALRKSGAVMEVAGRASCAK